jgi:hypothetical protein
MTGQTPTASPERILPGRWAATASGLGAFANQETELKAPLDPPQITIHQVTSDFIASLDLLGNGSVRHSICSRYIVVSKVSSQSNIVE